MRGLANQHFARYKLAVVMQRKVRHIAEQGPQAHTTNNIVGVPYTTSSFKQFWIQAQTYWPHVKKYGWLIRHLFSLKRARNNVYFEKKLFRSPTEVIYVACSFISYYQVGLQQEEAHDMLEQGVEALKVATRSFDPQEAWQDDC